jgi:hypothetical protein
MKYLLSLLIPSGLFRRWRYDDWKYPSERQCRWTARRQYWVGGRWVDEDAAIQILGSEGFVIKGNRWN